MSALLPQTAGSIRPRASRPARDRSARSRGETMGAVAFVARLLHLQTPTMGTALPYERLGASRRSAYEAEARRLLGLVLRHRPNLRLVSSFVGGKKLPDETVARIRELRYQQLPLLEVAEIVGVAQSTVFNLTRDIPVKNSGGRRKLTVSEQKALARAHWVLGLNYAEVGRRYSVSRTRARHWSLHHKSLFVDDAPGS